MGAASWAGRKNWPSSKLVADIVSSPLARREVRDTIDDQLHVAIEWQILFIGRCRAVIARSPAKLVADEIGQTGNEGAQIMALRQKRQRPPGRQRIGRLARGQLEEAELESRDRENRARARPPP